MPGRQTHVAVGILVGSELAAYRAREQEPLAALLETVGGAVGGYFGGRLPDIIEPALWPGHRQFVHSVAAGSGIAYGLYKLLEEWEKECRSRAEHYSNKRGEDSAHWWQKFFFTVLEIFFRVVAGGLSGLSAAYMSHLFLDGSTPKSIPVIS
jgi:MFS family permease